MKDKFDVITSDFTYVRWLGDRKGIEEKTTTWDRVIVDRQGDLSEWVNLLKKVQERRIMILTFPNNHYAGHGPSTVELFRRLWGMEAPRAVHRPQRPALQSTLFEVVLALANLQLNGVGQRSLFQGRSIRTHGTETFWHGWDTLPANENGVELCRPEQENRSTESLASRSD